MTIYNKEPILILWDLLKSLDADIPVYKEIMNEEEEDIPESYILLRSQVTDVPLVFGNGTTKIRQADCDVMLISKGYAENTTDLHNVNKLKIRNELKSEEVNFQEYNLGYNDSMKSTQHTFSFEVAYCG